MPAQNCSHGLSLKRPYLLVKIFDNFRSEFFCGLFLGYWITWKKILKKFVFKVGWAWPSKIDHKWHKYCSPLSALTVPIIYSNFQNIDSKIVFVAPCIWKHTLETLSFGNIICIWKQKKYIGNIHLILPIFQYHIGNIRIRLETNSAYSKNHFSLETHILETYTI